MASEDFSNTKLKPIKTLSPLTINPTLKKLSRKHLQIDEVKLVNITTSYYQNEFKVNKSTGNINVKCPFHDDKKPSLSVDLQSGAFNCHSPACGVHGTNIIGYHSKRYNLNFIDTVRHLGVEKNNHGKNKKVSNPSIETIKKLFPQQFNEGFELKSLQTYHDVSSKPIYWRPRLEHPDGRKHIRPVMFDGNKFRVKEPAFDGKKPLYNLHLLTKSNHNEVVIIPEGEICADTVVGLGGIGVTSGAANSPNKADWSQCKNRHALIFPDNDRAGIKFAKSVCEVLSGITKSISVIDVAALGLQKGSDIVDWLKETPSATINDLIKLPRLPIANTVINDNVEIGTSNISNEIVNHLTSKYYVTNDHLGKYHVEPSSLRRIRDYVFVVNQDKIFNLKTKCLQTKSSFCDQYSHLHTKDHPRRSIGHFIKSGELGVVDDLTNVPFRFDQTPVVIIEEDNKLLINMFTPSELTSNEGSFNNISDYIQYLLVSTDQIEIMLDFMAFTAQFPEEAIRWLLVMCGPQEIGKSLLFEQIITPIIGSKNTSWVTERMVLGQFSSWREKPFIWMPEIDNPSSGTMSALKSFLSDQFVIIEHKMQRAYQIRKSSKMLAASNRPNPFPVNENDHRRYCFLKTVSKSNKRSKRFFTELIVHIENELPAFLHYLLKRKITNNFANQAPMTTAKQDVIIQHFTPYLEEAKYIIEAMGDCSKMLPGNKTVSICSKFVMAQYKFFFQSEFTHRLVDYLQNTDHNERLSFQKASQFSRDLLTECGCISVLSTAKDRRFKYAGLRHSVWFPPNTNILQISEIMEILKSPESNKIVQLKSS